MNVDDEQFKKMKWRRQWTLFLEQVNSEVYDDGDDDDDVIGDDNDDDNNEITTKDRMTIFSLFPF